MSNPSAVFIINLLQDINIVRPLIFMTSRDLGFDTYILVSEKFFERDKSGAWQAELIEISNAVGRPYTLFAGEFEALQLIQGRWGVLIAASESDLPAHAATHNVMRAAPDGFVRLTLQHGFEGVGFLQSREHDLAHGTAVTFAADVLCGWFPAARQTSMVPSQRPKLYVTGPTSVLQTMNRSDGLRRGTGLVCENLHSVRLNAAGDFKGDFVSTFSAFCDALSSERQSVVLRPHPGGQYSVKHDIPLPANVTLNNDPIYRVNLASYAYGISAPSSVLIDMILAGIPVAVWRDGSGTIDSGNYNGLMEISSVIDWINFSREATAHPERFLERQGEFLERQDMPTDPAEVYRRFLVLLRRSADIARMNVRPGDGLTADQNIAASHRILFIANDLIPTLQLSFLKPLHIDEEEERISTDIITDKEIDRRFPKGSQSAAVRGWLNARVARFRPTVIIFCRYSGPHAAPLVSSARLAGIPVIYHIDDDLLNVPIEIGTKKHQWHNDPHRLETVRSLLDMANIVYCSTAPLAARLQALGVTTPMVAGALYCSGSVIKAASQETSRKIGYMGFDHARDLGTVLPAIVRLLRARPGVTFELFGSIPRPPELDEFGDRVVVVPPVRDYSQFLEFFASLRWDIGICPLEKTSFNLLKANTKWVEYTSVGAAVVAARDTVYEECCADDSGILADSEDEWYAALDRLIARPSERESMIRNAQAKLKAQYSVGHLRNQVLDVIRRAEVSVDAIDTVLFFSPEIGPTLQLSFIRPLLRNDASKKIAVDVVSTQQLNARSRDSQFLMSNRDWIASKLDRIEPSVIVLSRYSGPYERDVLRWARDRNVATVFHIDDDLLDVPIELGKSKAATHNSPDRLATVRQLLDEVDLVYASTGRLRQRLIEAGAKAPVVAGEIYCPGRIISAAKARPVRRVGYMASADHAHNLTPLLPAIVTYMQRHPEVTFEFFGSIPKPLELEQFGARVRTVPPIKDYGRFLEEFAKQEWDIGICPLAPIPFNLMKANTKWVEYTSVGAAVIASRGAVYDECCADGCGILADTPDEWLAALEFLTRNPDERRLQVERAQERLTADFTEERLLEQVMRVFDMAKANAAARRGPEVEPEQVAEPSTGDV